METFKLCNFVKDFTKIRGKVSYLTHEGNTSVFRHGTQLYQVKMYPELTRMMEKHWIDIEMLAEQDEHYIIKIGPVIQEAVYTVEKNNKGEDYAMLTATGTQTIRESDEEDEEED